MSDLNSVTIVGRLTADAVFFNFQGDEKGFAKFSIAVNSYKNNREESYYFNVSHLCGSKIIDYLKKGKRVAIEGELVQESWISKKTAEKMSGVKIQARKVHFISDTQSAKGAF